MKELNAIYNLLIELGYGNDGEIDINLQDTISLKNDILKVIHRYVKS